MSKKHKKRIETLAEINPEKDMPLPERLKAEEPIELPVEAPEPEIKASEVKRILPEPEIVESGFVSTKVNLYRR